MLYARSRFGSTMRRWYRCCSCCDDGEVADRSDSLVLPSRASCNGANPTILVRAASVSPVSDVLLVVVLVIVLVVVGVVKPNALAARSSEHVYRKTELSSYSRGSSSSGLLLLLSPSRRRLASTIPSSSCDSLVASFCCLDLSEYTRVGVRSMADTAATRASRVRLSRAACECRTCSSND